MLTGIYGSVLRSFRLHEKVPGYGLELRAVKSESAEIERNVIKREFINFRIGRHDGNDRTDNSGPVVRQGRSRGPGNSPPDTRRGVAIAEFQSSPLLNVIQEFVNERTLEPSFQFH